MKRYFPTLRERDQDDQTCTTSTHHSSLTLQPYTKNPHLPQFNSYDHHKIHINAIFDLPTTSKTEHLKTKRKKKPPTILPDSNDTSTTASITNDESTIVSSFSHDVLLKMLEKNNTQFKKEFESSFKQEVADQLKTNNDSIMDKINQ